MDLSTHLTDPNTISNLRCGKTHIVKLEKKIATLERRNHNQKVFIRHLKINYPNVYSEILGKVYNERNGETK